jgi:hypothetical protein
MVVKVKSVFVTDMVDWLKTNNIDSLPETTIEIIALSWHIRVCQGEHPLNAFIDAYREYTGMYPHHLPTELIMVMIARGG